MNGEENVISDWLLDQQLVFCYQNCSNLLWEKNCSSDWKIVLKFKAEGQEFSKFLISPEQFIQTLRAYLENKST